MENKMKTAVMTDIGKMAFEWRDIPTPAADEALVRVEYVGICGSDLHFFESGRIGDFVVEPPFVLGHESGGVVVAVGENVSHLAPGDRVALEPGKTCKVCRYCREGKYNLCPDVIFFAAPPVDGVFCHYVAHEAALCFKLPDHVSTLEGALIEPLAVGFHAADQGGARIGQTAVVFGSGCIGLVSLLALKARGVARVFVVDCMQKRLDKALELGADAVVDFSHQDVVATLQELAGADGIDLFIETSGAQAAVEQAVAAARKGAAIVMVGYNASGIINVPMSVAMNKELRFETVFRYRHVYPVAIAAVAAGKADVKGIVTHTFDFDDLQRAMDESIADKAGIVKAVVRIG